MTKRNKIIYWIATTWLALGMVSTGLVQLFKANTGQGRSRYDYTFGLSCLFANNTGYLENFGSGSRPYSQIPVIKGMGLCRLFLRHVWSNIFAYGIG